MLRGLLRGACESACQCQGARESAPQKKAFHLSSPEVAKVKTLAEPRIMSRFRDESNSVIPHPEPIEEGETRGDGDHQELTAVHAGNQNS